MRVPAEKPEAFRTAGGGAADSGLEQQDACKDQSKLPHSKVPSAPLFSGQYIPQIASHGVLERRLPDNHGLVPDFYPVSIVSQLEKEAGLQPPPTAPGECGPAASAPFTAKVRCWFGLIFSFPAMLIALLGGVVFAFARQGLADPDIWFHLRNAEYLLTRLHVPRVEMYSFTVQGHPWINPEYLAEVPYYLAWRVFGLIGIKAVELLLVEGIFLGLIYLCWRESRNIKAAVVACYFTVFLAVVNFGPRTVLFGYGYLVLLLIVLERFRSQGRGPLWLIPPLFCLWINTHGSWSLGLVVFGVVVACGMIQGRWGKVEATRWTPSQLRKLCVAFGASIGALFVNPYGYRLVFYPLDLAFRQKVAVNHVAEWVSVDFHNTRGKVALILIVALVLAALLSSYRWQLHELALVLFGLYSGLTYIRFLFLLGILAAPLLAKVLADGVPPYRRAIDKPVLNAIIVAAVLVFIIRGFPSDAQLRQSIAKEYPADVLPYLKSHPHEGRVLNDYAWGGYLCWNDRDFKEFIDSRADIFVYAGVFQDYVKLIGLNKSQAILDQYGIRYVLFPRNAPLIMTLEQGPRWKVIFTGNTSVMLERIGAVPNIARERALSSRSELAW
jgi:hypothetical protein